MRRHSTSAGRGRRRVLLAVLGLSVLLAGMPTLGSPGAAAAPAPGGVASAAPSEAPRWIGPPHGSPLPHGGARSAATPAAVDPYAHYTSEPAPMGIADFGQDKNGTLYSYTTNEFLGTASVNSLYFDDSNNGGSQYYGSLQENVVLDFTTGGVAYTYWIQNVLFIDTSSNTAYYENNIWNLTTGNTGGMLSGSGDNTITSGNGSVSVYNGQGYYAAAYSGSDSLTYPATIQLLVRSADDLGIPRVTFSFNDGGGWHTYDTAVFFATKVSSALFSVDGSSYVDSYLYSDAELVFGGPGGGSSTILSRANLTLGLQFFNGHNLQEIPNAFDFGSNTAESVSQTIEGMTTSNGVPLAALSAGSTGSLNMLYDRGYAAIFNGTTKYAYGVYSVNNVSEGTYAGGEVNLTLVPGSYQISILQNGTVAQTADVVLTDGEYLAYSFQPVSHYQVHFYSEGLPAGTPWSVEMGKYLGTTSGSELNFTVTNGSYGYTVQVVPGYDASPRGGTLTVNGTNVTGPTIHWTVHEYLVYVQESGLPSGTAWGVDLGGVAYPSQSAQIAIPLANGSYPWYAFGVPGYQAAVASGVLNISGPPGVLAISYTVREFPLTFAETGLAPGAAWIVDLAGVNYPSTTNVIQVNVANGTYSYSISTVALFDPTPAHGQVTVQGRSAAVTVEYYPSNGTVSLTVNPGTASISVNGGTLTVEPNGSYTLHLPPGQYNISVSAPGYLGISRIVVVAPGQSISLPIDLVPKPLPPKPIVGSSNTTATPWFEYGVIAGLAVVAVAVAAVALRRRPPTR